MTKRRVRNKAPLFNEYSPYRGHEVLGDCLDEGDNGAHCMMGLDG